MKPMNDSIFVDSNIFLYAFTQIDDDSKDEEIRKQEIASNIILGNISISTQVINEVSNNFIRKLGFSNSDVKEFVESCYSRYNIINFSQELFVIASELRAKYNLSYYDSMIVSAGLKSGATILYSEDMHNGLIVENQLQIVNPFKAKE
jgi:predicted nucleic acid-binding protein